MACLESATESSSSLTLSSVDDANYDSQSESERPPFLKRKKYSCVWRKQYTESFPWARESKKGRSFTFCMSCRRDIKVVLRPHHQTNVHSRSERSSVGVMPLRSYFGDTAVIEAEVKFAHISWVNTILRSE